MITLEIIIWPESLKMSTVKKTGTKKVKRVITTTTESSSSDFPGSSEVTTTIEQSSNYGKRDSIRWGTGTYLLGREFENK